MCNNGTSYYCDNCGNYIGEGTANKTNSTYYPPWKAVTYTKAGFFGLWIRRKVFCSEKCKREWKNKNG